MRSLTDDTRKWWVLAAMGMTLFMVLSAAGPPTSVDTGESF